MLSVSAGSLARYSQLQEGGPMFDIFSAACKPRWVGLFVISVFATIMDILVELRGDKRG